MTDEVIRKLISSATALAMERIQRGKYQPPTEKELEAIQKQLEKAEETPDPKVAMVKQTK